MNILYDGQMFCMQKTGGINRYFTEIISRLPDDSHPCITISHKESVLFPKHKNLNIHESPYRNFIPAGLMRRLEPFYFRAFSGFGNYDIFHPTFYKGITGKKHLKGRCPMVVTFWDILHKLYPQQLDPDGTWGEQIRRTVESADVLICISNNTKGDLLKYYSVKPEIVHVVHLAGTLNKPAEGVQNELTEDLNNVPYFLYVGARKGYKNFKLLLDVFAKLTARFSDIRLMVAGENFSDTEMKEIGNLRLQNKIQLYEFPSDQLLSLLYRNSLALVYPSEYEGFGLPPLEAMNCGSTVIASKSSSLPEIISDAGLLIDTTKEDELYDAMQNLISDQSFRQQLIKKSALRSDLFSWDKTAKNTYEIYKSVC